MLCFLFVPAFEYKIYCLMLYHLLKSTLHPKANACSIGTFITFYMQSSLYSKANACNIGTFIRSYIQMRVQIKNKAFAYRFYRPFTQQCMPKTMPVQNLLRYISFKACRISGISKMPKDFFCTLPIFLQSFLVISGYFWFDNIHDFSG